MSALRNCASCGRPMVPQRHTASAGQVRHVGRGLCISCYERVARAGNLADYPTSLRAYDVLRDDLDTLSGLSAASIAKRMSMAPGSIAKALSRHGMATEARPFWREQNWRAAERRTA